MGNGGMEAFFDPWIWFDYFKALWNTLIGPNFCLQPKTKTLFPFEKKKKKKT